MWINHAQPLQLGPFHYHLCISMSFEYGLFTIEETEIQIRPSRHDGTVSTYLVPLPLGIHVTKLPGEVSLLLHLNEEVVSGAYPVQVVALTPTVLGSLSSGTPSRASTWTGARTWRCGVPIDIISLVNFLSRMPVMHRESMIQYIVSHIFRRRPTIQFRTLLLTGTLAL